MAAGVVAAQRRHGAAASAVASRPGLAASGSLRLAPRRCPAATARCAGGGACTASGRRVLVAGGTLAARTAGHGGLAGSSGGPAADAHAAGGTARAATAGCDPGSGGSAGAGVVVPAHVRSRRRTCAARPDSRLGAPAVGARGGRVGVGACGDRAARARRAAAGAAPRDIPLRGAATGAACDGGLRPRIGGGGAGLRTGATRCGVAAALVVPRPGGGVCVRGVVAARREGGWWWGARGGTRDRCRGGGDGRGGGGGGASRSRGASLEARWCSAARGGTSRARVVTRRARGDGHGGRGDGTLVAHMCGGEACVKHAHGVATDGSPQWRGRWVQAGGAVDDGCGGSRAGCGCWRAYVRAATGARCGRQRHRGFQGPGGVCGTSAAH